MADLISSALRDERNGFHRAGLLAAFRLSVLWTLLYMSTDVGAQVLPKNYECSKASCSNELVSVGEQISCDVYQALQVRTNMRRFHNNTAFQMKHGGGAGNMVQLELISNDIQTGLSQSAFAGDLGFKKNKMTSAVGTGKNENRYQLTVTVSQFSAAVWLEVKYEDMRGGPGQLVHAGLYPIAVPKRYTKGNRR